MGDTVETSEWGAYKTASAVSYVLLVLSMIIGLLIGWASLMAQSYLSATTMLVLTNLNKVIVVAIGMIYMGEASSWQAILGLTIALSGGVWYGRVQATIKKKNAAVQAAPAPAPAAK